MDDKKERERHPFRALLKLIVVAGIVGFIVSFINGKKLEYTGLTESEARRKFEEKLGPRMGEERAAEVADQVIPKLKERGVIVADPIADAVDEVVEDFDSDTSTSTDE